jgi:small-conductance mechanosensitive channel
LIIAALDIFALLDPTATVLDSIALTIGATRLSLLLVVKAVLVIGVLLWTALAVARLLGARIQYLTGLSPSVQALTGNLLKIMLVSLALVIGLNTVGIDLTAFAVFSGAVGVGLGFGLQKIVSNFVSGIILLVEQSIKPGDVIEVGHTYGAVTALGARYATVRGRDGKEFLIPNETLITNQVTNWSYTTPLLRLDIAFGVGYGSDLREVRGMAIEAARQTRRVVASPAPVCRTGSRTSRARSISRCGTASASTGSNCPTRNARSASASGRHRCRARRRRALPPNNCPEQVATPAPRRLDAAAPTVNSGAEGGTHEADPSSLGRRRRARVRRIDPLAEYVIPR